MFIAPSSQVKEGSPGDNPPAPRKRGRPRKIVQEAAKVEDPLSVDVKKPITSGEADGMSSAQKRLMEGSEAAPGENGQLATASLTEDPANSKTVRRDGSRRKSEPRRAAESLLSGT